MMKVFVIGCILLVLTMTTRAKPMHGMCFGQKNCCNPANQCGIMQGGCKTNRDCMKGLTCGRNNCPWGGRDRCCQGPIWS